MNPIQWFPGHMAKAQKEIEEKLKLVDIVLELIDARIPKSSINPVFENILKNKKKLVIMTKVKLADPIYNNQWKDHFDKLGEKVLLVDSVSGYNVNKIINVCKEVLKDKIEKDKRRGMKERPLRMMVLGIPNVGKSTLINSLVGKKITKTANKPGVTKAQQWIRINSDFDLLDTPGVLWPKFDSTIIGYHLALTGAIKDDVVPKDDMILYFINFLRDNYPDAFLKRYNIDLKEVIDNLEVLDNIAKMKNYLKKDSYDYEHVYEMILTDFRNLNLANITLERC